MPRVDFVRLNQYRRMVYKFVRPDYESELDFAVHDDPNVIELCAQRLRESWMAGTVTFDRTRSGERSMLVFEALVEKN